MKKITKYLAVFVLLITVSCVAQKTSQEIEEVVFSAQTRGSSENITVVNYNVFHKTQKDSKTHFINKDNRDALEAEVKKMSLSKISDLKAPSNKRAFDGAMHARITIKIGNKTYVSSDFDDNNPPEELKVLVDLLRGFVK